MTMGEARDIRPELSGVGGWLAFLCVSLLILTPMGAVVEIAGSVLNPNTPPLENAIGVLAVLVLTAFAIVTGIGLLRMWANAVRLAKAYFLVNLALALTILASAFLPEGSVQVALLGVRLCVGSVAWLAYLYRSERVRNTYGKNTVRDAAEVFR